MKYYVDYNNGQIKIDVEKEFYQSENLENKITVLLTNVTDPYFLSIEFLRSDGRKCTIQTADAFGEDEDTTLTEDDVTYDIHNFTLTEQVLKCAGTLMFTVYINFVNSDTGNVIRRGVLLNGVNNVKKTVPYSTNSLLVIDDEEEAETTVTNILNELTQINAALATKQKKLVLQSDSGLTMTDSYKLKVKLWESGGLSVDNLGVKINYSYDDFQIAKTPNYENKKIMKLNYFYNTAPVNKSSVYVSNGGTPTGTSSLFMNNLTVTSTSISQIGNWQVEGTKYTYTFSGQTAKCIAKNDNHPYEFLTYYTYDTNMTNSYSLSLDTTDSVCKQLLQDFINLAGRKYSHFMSTVTIPTGAVVIFKPIGKVGNVIYFSCENFMCTKTEENYANNFVSKIVLVNIILGLVKDGNNYKVEFEVENSTGKVFTASNSKIYMPTELLKSVRATAMYNSEQELLYKFLEAETDSFYHEIIRIDTEPVDGSTHLIESGGVKAAIDSAVASLDAAKQDVISPSNKVDADNVDDTNSTHKFATAEQLAQIATNASEISKVKSVQNCVDTVASYSALQSYVTTNLDVNDKIQVIADENYSNATTIYNWTGSVWEYIGAYGGNSYTKAQTNALLDGKADKSTTYTKTETNALLDGKLEVISVPGVTQVGTRYDITDSDTISKLDDDYENEYYHNLEFNNGDLEYFVDGFSDTFSDGDFNLTFKYDGYTADDDFYSYSCVWKNAVIHVQLQPTSNNTYYVTGSCDLIPIADNTTTEMVDGIISVKSSYIDAQFLTDAEMATLISEVFD